MKKISLILAVLGILALAGCASSGGGSSGGGGGGAAYSVDLSTVTVSNWSYTTKGLTAPVAGTRNVDPFSRQYDGVVVHFSNLSDVTGYQRITIKCKYYNADGGEIGQSDSMAMVVLIYDVNGDLEGPEMGAGPNTPLKEFNIGGFSGNVSTDRGSRVTLRQNPGGILFQASNAGVKFIEVTEVTFHN